MDPNHPLVFKAMIHFYTQIHLEENLDSRLMTLFSELSLLNVLGKNDLESFMNDWIASATKADQLLASFIILKEKEKYELAKKTILKVNESTKGLEVSVI